MQFCCLHSPNDKVVIKKCPVNPQVKQWLAYLVLDTLHYIIFLFIFFMFFLFRINKKYSEINLKCDNFSPGCQSERAVF